MPGVKKSTGPQGFLPETVMTRPELAAVLRTSEDSLERSTCPVSYTLGDRQPRYIWSDVVAWLRKGIAA